jgi:hypothetical protein
MKNLLFICVILIAVLAVFALAQTTPNAPTDQRIEALEKRVQALEAQMQELRESIRPKIRPAK